MRKREGRRGEKEGKRKWGRGRRRDGGGWGGVEKGG
jgi:hypothetical protein